MPANKHTHTHTLLMLYRTSKQMFPVFKNVIKNVSFSGTNTLCWAFRELIWKLFFFHENQKYLSSQANQAMILCYEILFW